MDKTLTEIERLLLKMVANLGFVDVKAPAFPQVEKRLLKLYRFGFITMVSNDEGEYVYKVTLAGYKQLGKGY